MDLNKLLTDISTVANLMKEQLEEVKRLRADMDVLRAEHKQMNEVVQNHGTTMQNFADIAFDDNKFTQELLSRCEEAAEQAAKDAIDIDDIASEVADNIDVSEDVARYVERLDVVSEDKVNDMIQDYINENNILNTDEVEEVVSDYIQHNCDFVEQGDVEDMVRRLIGESLKGHADYIVQLIANKLTAKGE